MSSKITLPASFSVASVKIGQPKSLDSGAKMAYLNYGESRALILQTPTLKSPFGLNIFDKNGPPKYSIDLALTGYQENPKVKAFYKALSDLDNFMIEEGVRNSKAWFKSQMTRDVVAAFYTPTVKFGRDKEGNQTPYPPNVNLKLKKNREGTDFDCEFYDHQSKGNPNAPKLTGIPIEEMLVKKVEVTGLMQCTGVWFAGGKFGLTWKAILLRLDSVPQGIHGNALLDDDLDGEAGGEFSSPAPAPRPVVEEDSDEEEDTPAPPPAAKPAEVVDSDEEEEVAPAPVPKKTTVTKAKVVKTVKK
jgi:hypothetical protein